MTEDETINRIAEFFKQLAELEALTGLQPLKGGTPADRLARLMRHYGREISCAAHVRAFGTLPPGEAEPGAEDPDT